MCGSFLDVYVATCVYMNDFVTCIIYSKFILYHITSYIYCMVLLLLFWIFVVIELYFIVLITTRSMEPTTSIWGTFYTRVVQQQTGGVYLVFVCIVHSAGDTFRLACFGFFSGLCLFCLTSILLAFSPVCEVGGGERKSGREVRNGEEVKTGQHVVRNSVPPPRPPSPTPPLSLPRLHDHTHRLVACGS